MTDTPNPYESPKSSSAAASPPVATPRIESAWTRIKRATVKSIAFGVLGFAVFPFSMSVSMAIAFLLRVESTDDSSIVEVLSEMGRRFYCPAPLSVCCLWWLRSEITQCNSRSDSFDR